MRARAGRGDPGVYAERDAQREPALDRMAGVLRAYLRRALARTLRPSPRLADEVAAHAARLLTGGPGAQVAGLRYRLRRDGLSGPQLAECFGLYVAALGGEPTPSPAALDAAAAIVAGELVDIADPAGRWQALALAATAFALCGVPVHLYAASEPRAAEAATLLRKPLGALGLGVSVVDSRLSAAERRVAYGAAVACGTSRVLGLDYLRDRVRLGRRQRPLQGRIERLSGDTTSTGQMPVLAGLHCALVEDADQVLIDEARLPILVTGDGASADRLPYEQALELTGALEPGADFVLDAGGARLTARGAERLGELSVLLGGLWTAREAREEMVSFALIAVHGLQRGRDYEVAQGALRLAAVEPGAEGPPEQLLRLLQAKEALPFAGRQDVIARLSVPQFFRRYLRLAGVCADARGMEGELWSVYGLHATRAGPTLPAPACDARAFVTAAHRRAALAASVRSRAGRGDAVAISVRSAAEAGAVAAALQEAGVRFSVLRGADDRAALDAISQPGGVALSVFPAHRGLSRAPSAEAPLHLALAELHEAGRHAQQIERSYAAASCEQFLALEDEGMAERLGAVAARRARHAADASGQLTPAAAATLARTAQRASEGAAARARREALAREQAMEELLAFSGRPE